MEEAKCLVELDEILKHLSREDFEKIPYEIREGIKREKDNQYNWTYDETKELNEQNINRKTIIMLSYLNLEYLLNERQKIFMEQLHRENELKVEQEKMKKYNSNDIFRKQEKSNRKEGTALLEIKTEKWYEKIVLFIKKFFKGR